MQYTTVANVMQYKFGLCYQDFKDTFVCNTQHLISFQQIPLSCVIRISKILLYAIHNPRGVWQAGVEVVLSGFQRYFCMQYTTFCCDVISPMWLCYQDFKDTFVCNTQLYGCPLISTLCCVIRISKILLYAIHNRVSLICASVTVVLSGFQRYFCMQYTTPTA